MKKLITAIILTLMMVGQASAVTVTYTWTAPTTGTPVVYYEIEQNVDNAGWQPFGTTINPELTTETPVGMSIIRVAGVDEFGRRGVWSTESEPLIDLGAPGGCGVISRFIESLN